MYLLIQTQLMIESWHLFLTGIGTCVIVFAFIWNFNRARKNDFKEAMNKKADKTMVNEKIKGINIRMTDHENNNNLQFQSMNGTLEEIQAGQEYANKKTDDIYKMLINMKK